MNECMLFLGHLLNVSVQAGSSVSLLKWLVGTALSGFPEDRRV